MIFAAPPCGTSSRAREKAIPGISNPPKPLRSEQHPDGLPFLAHADKLKTEIANLVYEAVANVVKWSDSESIPIVVENPLRSYMWLTSPFKEVEHMLPIQTIFQNCMHGSSRDKWTLLKSSTELPQPLAALRDKKHRRESWQPRTQDGKLCFPAHSEAAYPGLFCQRVAGLLLRDSMAKGALDFSDLQRATRPLFLA